MKTTVTVSVNFSGAHRLVGVNSVCGNLHGYFYCAEFTFIADKLNKTGMIIEFESAKQKLKKWLDENWDHTVILHKSDKKLGEAIAKITGQKIFYLDVNPTTENKAEYLIKTVCPKLFKTSGAKCVKVHLQETPENSVSIEH